MGIVAAFFGYMVQIVWDSLGSYMLTPGTVALPQVDQPVGWSLRAMLNPSFVHLLTHRTFGDFSYVMLLTGGVFALRYRGQYRKDPTSENTAYFRWASGTCFLIGFLFFFPMPIIGWLYAGVIQREAPAAFLALMGGHTSRYFLIKMSLILFFLAVGGTFVVTRYRSKAVVGAITAGLLIVLTIVQVHPPLRWLGGNVLAWRLAATAVVLGLIGWLWARRGTGNPDRRAWPWAMFIVGLAAFFTFALGGFVRERSRSPDTVYGEIVKPEWTQPEADRYLVYTKWLQPRGLYPEDLDRQSPEDWQQEVQQARRQGLELTDEEAQRIIRYLEERH
jgi:cytochrome bd-type quinol oxidase subunit 1